MLWWGTVRPWPLPLQEIAMPHDAKLGLLAGVALVIATAVVYFRRDQGGEARPSDPTAAVQAPAAVPASSEEASSRIVKGKTTSRQHTLAEGETLFSLAERYYGDKSRAAQIFQANRHILHGPDDLKPGTLLIIPEESPPPPQGPR